MGASGKGREAGAAEPRANHETMLSALLMLARVRNAMRYAVQEEDFLTVFAAGAFLVFLGTRAG